MKYRHAIFDFDGTLADSYPFFLRVFNELADRHGFKRIDIEQADSFRHCSAREMMRHVGIPAWKLPMVARSFTDLMQRHAASIALFEGIEASLRHLADEGVVLSIVSSNSADNVRAILGVELTPLFSQLECGMSMFGKAARLKKVLRNSHTPAEAAIYIGDQITDIEAARKAKIAFGAVAWGYGTMASLRQHHPEEEFDQVPALRSVA